MKTEMSTHDLLLPASIEAEAEEVAEECGTTLNNFVASAVTEKVSAMRAASFFLEKKGKTDWTAFDRITGRSGGEASQAGDEMV